LPKHGEFHGGDESRTRCSAAAFGDDIVAAVGAVPVAPAASIFIGASAQKLRNGKPLARLKQSSHEAELLMSADPRPQSPQDREWSREETVHSPVLPKDEARQGVTGHNVRYVLGIGLAAVILVFLIIYLVYFA
jgi:hypothetical protein